MSELTKQQLAVENNTSFPNNNTGFITPTLLRTFNGNIIDSMVDEVTYNADSASWTSDIAQLEQFSASLDANFVSTAELNASSSTLQNNINTKLNTSSFNAYTASQEVISASFNTRINSVTGSATNTGSLLLTASAVSNVITFTKGDGSTFPVTVGSVIDSSSLVSTSSFNAYTQSAASGVSASINAATSSLSASIAVTDLAQSSSIAQLLGFSSSLDTTFATDAQLSASASTLQNNINTRLLTSSFQTYTSSITSQLAGIGQSLAGKLNTSSLSVTQNITGSIIISGSSTGAGGETLRLFGGVNPATDLALHILSGSFELTTPQGNGAHFYSNAPITSSNLRINGTAVIKDLFVSGTWGGTGSGSLFVENSITASVISASQYIGIPTISTGSYATTGSNTFNGNQIISGNLDISGSVRVVSASVLFLEVLYETASIIYSSGSNQFGDASDDIQTLFGKVDIKTGPLVITGSTFVSGNITLANGSDLITHHIQAAASNGIEIQNNSGNNAILVGAGGSLGTTFYGQINATSISASGNITGNLIGTASYATKALTASFAENVVPTDVSMFLSQSTFNSYTQSNDSKVNALISSTGSYTTTSSFNSYTQSNNSKVDTLIAATSSYITSAQTASMTVLSSSFATTASFALNAGASVDTGSLVTSASFNSYTASNDSKVNSLINKTGSFITTGSSTSVQNITGSLIISGATFNGKIEAPALSIGVTTLDVLFESTASTTASSVVSEIDFTRIGAGPTGDSTGVRLQTLSGSDTTGDTLLSRVTTNINRHTTTAMTGSVVNTIVQSTWATGSAGTRISYSSTITANAQSASATITLAAGNAASNYAGGTASLQAGRVNIGTTSATITSTGSFTHLGSFVTSQGITTNNGGITATSGSINGEFRVNGSINITGSNPTIQSGSLSGSLVSTLTDTYASTPQGNFIVTLDSASMASLLAGSSTNANTIYFVI